MKTIYSIFLLIFLVACSQKGNTLRATNGLISKGNCSKGYCVFLIVLLHKSIESYRFIK